MVAGLIVALLYVSVVLFIFLLLTFNDRDGAIQRQEVAVEEAEEALDRAGAVVISRAEAWSTYQSIWSPEAAADDENSNDAPRAELNNLSVREHEDRREFNMFFDLVESVGVVFGPGAPDVEVQMRPAGEVEEFLSRGSAVSTSLRGEYLDLITRLDTQSHRPRILTDVIGSYWSTFLNLETDLKSALDSLSETLDTVEFQNAEARSRAFESVLLLIPFFAVPTGIAAWILRWLSSTASRHGTLAEDAQQRVAMLATLQSMLSENDPKLREESIPLALAVIFRPVALPADTDQFPFDVSGLLNNRAAR